MLNTLLCLSCCFTPLTSGVSPSTASWALPQRLPVPAVTAADTTVIAPSAPLTTESITEYGAIEKELAAYWAAHQTLLTAARTHQRYQNIPIGDGTATAQLEAIDYAAVVSKDTVVAAIFARHHLTPAQFTVMQAAVYNAIAAIIAGRAVDSAKVIGKNMTFVQVHRAELGTDWTLIQTIMAVWQQEKGLILQQAKQKVQTGDLAP